MNRSFSHLRLFAALTLLLSIVSCGSGGSNQDLREYISQTKAKPAGRIDEIPSFTPYESFIYGAAGLRSPFEQPLDVAQRIFARASKDVKPDLARTKEYLERFDFNSLQMVGTLEIGGTLWALIEDNLGGIHRATVGNYLGKNHGQIKEADKTKIEVVEIVSDGLNGWLERPRVLAITEKE